MAFFSDKLTFLYFWDMLNLRKLPFCSYLVIFPPYLCHLGPYKAYAHVYYAYAYAYVDVYAYVSFLGPSKNEQKNEKLLGAHQAMAMTQTPPFRKMTCNEIWMLDGTFLFLFENVMTEDLSIILLCQLGATD